MQLICNHDLGTGNSELTTFSDNSIIWLPQLTRLEVAVDKELSLGFKVFLSKIETSATVLKALRFTVHTAGSDHQHESIIHKSLAPLQSQNSHLLFAGIDSLRITVKIGNRDKVSTLTRNERSSVHQRLWKLICAVLEERWKAGAKDLILQDPEDHYYQGEHGHHGQRLDFSAVKRR